MFIFSAQDPFLCSAHGFVIAVNAAYPATWPAHALLELRHYSPDVIIPGFLLLGQNGPADPLVAGQGGGVLPFGQSFGVGK